MNKKTEPKVAQAKNPPTYECNVTPNSNEPGRYYYAFDCPCGERHRHGGDKRDFPGHRVAHCRGLKSSLHPAGYFLKRRGAGVAPWEVEDTRRPADFIGE